MFQNPETQKIWPHFVFCVPLEKGLTKNENKKGGQNWFCVDYRKQPHHEDFSAPPCVRTSENRENRVDLRRGHGVSILPLRHVFIKPYHWPWKGKYCASKHGYDNGN